MQLGMTFPRELPAPLVVDIAERLEAGGADELWVIEDCFFTTGVSLAATALARTSRLVVGIGIMPAVARTAPMTAMEIATLCALAPGRLIAGIGHGVQEWMDQMGVRPASPVTALTEVITAVRALLRGERLTTDGDYVRLTDVALEYPPHPVPPVLAGVRGPKSLAAAGRCADGLVLAELSGPTAVRAAVATAAPAGPFSAAAFSVMSIADDRAEARRNVAPLVVDLVGAPPPGLRAAPFFDDLAALVARDGADGVVAAPDDWWVELGAIGTLDDAVAHISAMEAAGVSSLSFFPAPVADVALAQVDQFVGDVLPATR
jgi:alkanesulfonate monooxygenase SsuD/methylene tetrahydromethanopterin reductase-like flavin-dependent oxidoreductase (luciferase family)